MININNLSAKSVEINIEPTQKNAYGCDGCQLFNIKASPYKMEISIKEEINIEMSYLLETYVIRTEGIATFPDEIEYIKETNNQIIIKFISEGKICKFIGDIKIDNESDSANDGI